MNRTNSTTDNTQESPSLATFEQSVAELEALVTSLEGGDISLEQAMDQFERGTTLARQCQDMLKQAELRIDQLVERNGEHQPEAFNAPDADAGDPAPDQS